MSIGVPRTQKFGEDLRGVAHDADRERLAGIFGRDHEGDSFIEIGRVLVEVAVLDAPCEPRLVDVDDQHRPVIHRDREGLRTAHPSTSGCQRQRAAQRVAPE